MREPKQPPPAPPCRDEEVRKGEIVPPPPTAGSFWGRTACSIPEKAKAPDLIWN